MKMCGLSLRIVALAALTLQTTSAVILTRYSKIISAGPPYYSTTLVLMAELAKFVLSLFLVFVVDARAAQPDGARFDFGETFRTWKDNIVAENFVNPRDTLHLAIPAALYTLQNNLIYVALNNLEATTFQVGYQMKIITTAVLSVLMLNRRLSAKKWVALLLLTVGIIGTQVDSSSKVQLDKSNHQQSFPVGIVSVLTCGCCSAFAGVYFEKILKGSNPSVWMRNTQLAFFSGVIALVGVLGDEGARANFFQGYSWIVWAIVAVQAVGGLIIAVVVKYADNILKGFATALSILLCGAASAVLFGFQPSTTFAVGSMVVMGATMLYSAPDTSPGNSPNTLLPLGRKGSSHV